MPPISVVICCANSAATLAAACETATWADELLIVDSGSTDSTPEIAKRYATRYVEEPWRGHSEQKKYAATLCKHDWVFFLDSDEECSPELAAELQALTDAQADGLDLLLVPRKNYVMGRLVRAWWPDYLTRVFHRERVTWPGHVLHDTREPSDPSRVDKLKGHLVHKRLSTDGFFDYFSGGRMDSRLLPVAKQMHERGKRCRWYDLWFRPKIAFFKFYIVKRSFMDGTFGLLMAQKAAVSTQLKYAALWAVQNGQVDEGDSDRPAG